MHISLLYSRWKAVCVIINIYTSEDSEVHIQWTLYYSWERSLECHYSSHDNADCIHTTHMHAWYCFIYTIHMYTFFNSHKVLKCRTYSVWFQMQKKATGKDSRRPPKSKRCKLWQKVMLRKVQTYLKSSVSVCKDHFHMFWEKSAL